MRCIHLLIVLIKSFLVFQLPLKTFATKHNSVNWTLRNRGCSGRVNRVHGLKFLVIGLLKTLRGQGRLSSEALS